MSEALQAIIGAILGGLICAAILLFDLKVFIPWVLRERDESRD